MAARLRLGDIPPGFEYQTPGLVVTESHIVGFAGLSGDFFDVHMDDDFAQSVGFKGRVAHGLLGLALVDGLKNRSAVLFDAIASLEWTYRFKKAVFPGDRIQARIRVLETRPTKRPDRGIVRLHFDVVNQQGEVVQEGENTLMIVA
jgi:3-hydroxybutyryl-CoA dehydratase